MNRKLLNTKLGVQIILCVIFSMICTCVLYMILTVFERNALSDKFRDMNFIISETKKEVDIFQKFIDENKILISDINKISRWVRDKHNIILIIYDKNKVVYDSTIVDFIPPKDNNEIDEKKIYRKLYDVKFFDSPAKIEMICFFEYKYIVIINYIKIIICFICFISIIALFIRKKTEYINQIENEIKILEGGNLEYKITVKGNDELSYLAKSIDDMRISFIERQKEEENSINANHKLVTAMSHDLRTPLTILIGLLEILDGKKYTTNEQLEKYIKKSRDKAYQIKRLSDKIFEYFLAFNINDEYLHMENYNFNVINEIIEDYIFTLENKNYTIAYSRLNSNAILFVDINYIHRVFDNIFSNIIKYADINKNINIYSNQSDNYINIYIENYVNNKSRKAESTNIGLETCKNIMKQHNGQFDYFLKDNVFKICVKFVT